MVFSQIVAEVGEILGGLVHAMVIVEDTEPPAESNTLSVTVPGVAVAGTVAITDEPVHVPVSVASEQSVSVELQALAGLVDVVV